MGEYCLECPPCPEQQSMFSILTICKVLGGLVTSVAYDYVTFKEEDENKDKKLD